MLYIGDMDR